MNIKSLIILVVFLIVGAGAYFYSGTKDRINVSERIGSPVIPDLQESLNDVRKIIIYGAKNQVLSTVSRSETGWSVPQKGGYPADVSKVRAMLLNLAEANIIEEKTSNPDLYSRLGVEDVTHNDAEGIKLVVYFDDSSAELIVGKPGPQINKSRYVRHVSEETSWLINRKLDLKHPPEYWLKKDILSIEPAQISTVKISLKDGSELEIANSGDDANHFSVVNLSDPDSQVVDAELHQLTNALSSFQLIDIGDAEKTRQLTPDMLVNYALKSGAVIKLTAYEIDGDYYATVMASLSDESEASVQAYVHSLQQATSGWVYKIPSVTYEAMYKREADVLAITEDQLN